MSLWDSNVANYLKEAGKLTTAEFDAVKGVFGRVNGDDGAVVKAEQGGKG